MYRHLILVILLFCSFPSLVRAQTIPGGNAAGLVIAVEGPVEVKKAVDTDWKPLQLKDRISESDTIRTGKDARVKVFLIDETTLSLGPQAELKIDKYLFSSSQNDRETRLKLFLGKIRVILNRSFSPQSQFEIHTPTTVASVKGTNFIVWVQSPTMTEVAVSEGVVSVRNINPEITGDVVLTRNLGSLVEINRKPTEPLPVEERQMNILKENLAARERMVVGGKTVVTTEEKDDRVLKEELAEARTVAQAADQARLDTVTPGVITMETPPVKVIDQPIRPPLPLPPGPPGP